MHRKKRLVLSAELKSFSTLYFRLSTWDAAEYAKWDHGKKTHNYSKRV